MAEHADAAGLVSDSDPVEPVEVDAAADTETSDDSEVQNQVLRRGRLSTAGAAILACAVVAVGLSAVGGWLGFRTYQDRQTLRDKVAMVAAARQGAVNLTTIDYKNVDADIQRILDTSVGTFHDDFQDRSDPFVKVVQQAQSTTQGTVTSAAFESGDANNAQVLVAVSVKTSNANGPEQEPRAWRMRVSVQKIDDQVKVSDVQFVA